MKNLVDECQEMVEMFVEEVDPISDYQLNYALMINCGGVVDEHCQKDQGLKYILQQFSV